MKTRGLPHREENQINPEIWRIMRETAINGDDWPLVLIGGVGSGKTCASLCMLDRTRIRAFHTVPSLCEKLIEIQNGRAVYGQSQDTLSWFWRRYRESDCVVVDELGARDAVSDFRYETVKRAIDERNGAPAIFISNLDLDQLAKIYDDRIASRLAGGTVIAFTGEDRRLSKPELMTR